MNAFSCFFLAAYLLVSTLHDPAEACTQPPSPGADRKIPTNLDEAVRAADGMIGGFEKEKIRRGEITPIDYHHTLGQWMRNRWHLWQGDSKLAVFFHEQGITHPDDMSSYILRALFLHIRGKPYDLLTLMRENEKQYPTYQRSIHLDGRPNTTQRFAVLFHRLAYDANKRVRATSLLWNPRDGQIYLQESSKLRRAREEEIEQLRQLKEFWHYSLREQQMLESLRYMTPAQRLTAIQAMDARQRAKFDSLLPRKLDPSGIDKRKNDLESLKKTIRETLGIDDGS